MCVCVLRAYVGGDKLLNAMQLFLPIGTCFCFSVVIISHTLVTIRGACYRAWLMKAVSKYLSNEDREGRNESQGTVRPLCVLL